MDKDGLMYWTIIEVALFMNKVILLFFTLFALSFSAISQETDLPAFDSELDKGMDLLKNGDFPGAEVVFRKILELDTDNHDAVIGLGRVVLYQDRLDEAYEIFSKAVEKYDSANSWFFRGYTQFKQGNNEAARQNYLEAIDRGYEHFDVYFNIGHTYYLDKMYEDGELWFGKSLDREPNYTPSWYFLGLCKFYQDIDAYYEFSKAVELDSTYVMAYFYRGILLDRIRAYERGAADFSKVVELDPDYAWGYFYLGKDLEKIDRSTEAVESFEKALSLGLINARVYDALAGSFWSLKKYGVAAEYYDKAVELSPQNAWVFNNRGYFLKQNKQKKDYNKAIEDFKTAIKLDPKWAAPYNYLGFIYNAQGKYKEAIVVLKEAVSLAPNWSWPWNNLGNAQQNTDNIEEAISSYNRSIECDPEYFYPHYNLGHLYYNIKEYEKAVEFYNNALDLNPEYTDSYNGLGLSLEHLKRNSEAIEAYTKGLEINPNDYNLLSNLGILYFLTDQSAKAAPDLERAIELNPGVAFYHKYLGRSYINLRMFDEAQLHLEKAIELNSSYAETLGKLLNELKALKNYLIVYLQWGSIPIEGLDITFIGLPKYDTKYISDSSGSVLIPLDKLSDGKDYYLYYGDYKNPTKDWEFSNTSFYYYKGLSEVRLQVKKSFSGINPVDEQIIHNRSPLLQWENPEGIAWFELIISRKTEELDNGTKTFTEFKRLKHVLGAEYQIQEELLPNEYYWAVTAFSKKDIPLYYLSSQFIVE